MTSEEVTSEEPVMETEPLTLKDRCDRCRAQAFVRCVLPGGGELMFCGHHAATHWDALRAQAVHIQDERDNINKQPSISANAT